MLKIIVTFSICVLAAFSSQAQLIPVVKGILPKDEVFGFTLSPSKDEAFFVKSKGGRDSLSIYQIKKTRTGWSKPKLATFSMKEGKWKDIDPMFSPDGKTVYFQSTRTASGKGLMRNFDLWYVIKTAKGWSAPMKLQGQINTDSAEAYASATHNGRLYFGSNRQGSFGRFDIFYSDFHEGTWGAAVNTGMEVNGADHDSNPYVAPDGSFIIFARNHSDGGFGDSDLYITFNKNGYWTKPWNLGPVINSADAEFCPYMIPGEDTVYLTRMQRGKRLRENIFKAHLPIATYQKLALAQANIFEPGKVSTGNETSITFEKDGNTAYFVRSKPERELAKVYKITKTTEGWSLPVVASFSWIDPSTVTPNVSADGNTILFTANRKNMDLWQSRKTEEGWSTPEPLDQNINTKDFHEYFGTIANNGTLYFSSNSGKGRGDIFRSRWLNGQWQAPEPIEEINTEQAESNPWIAPDESFLLLMAERPEGFGDYDLYISYLQDGKWTTPFNLGPAINSPIKDFQPCLSRDGEQFYFTRTSWPPGSDKRYGEENIYHLNASVLPLKK